MERKPIIAGNWKMNMTPAEAKELIAALIPLVADAACDVVICSRPSFLSKRKDKIKTVHLTSTVTSKRYLCS